MKWNICLAGNKNCKKLKSYSILKKNFFIYKIFTSYLFSSFNEYLNIKKIFKKKTIFFYLIQIKNLEENLYQLIQILSLNIPVIIIYEDLNSIKNINIENISKFLECRIFIFSEKRYDNNIKKIQNFLKKYKERRFNNIYKKIQIFLKKNNTFKVLEKKEVIKVNILFLDIFFNFNYDILNKFYYNNSIVNSFTNKKKLSLFTKHFLNLSLLLVIILLSCTFSTITKYLLYFLKNNLSNIKLSNNYLVNIYITCIQNKIKYSFLYKTIFSLILIVKSFLSSLPNLFFIYFYVLFITKSKYLIFIKNKINSLLFFIGIKTFKINDFFILLSSLNCNLSTISFLKENKLCKKNIIILMIAPFIICSARLSTYINFFTFFNISCQSFIISLYFISICISFITGFIINYVLPEKKYSFENVNNNLYDVKDIIYLSFIRTYKLVKSSLLYLVIISFILKGYDFSYLSKKISFLFIPLGFNINNISILITSIISGIFAKEAIFLTFLNLHFSYHGLHNKLLDSLLTNYFSSQYSFNAFLIFITLYFPCISVIVYLYKNFNIFWTISIILWTNIMAYFISYIYYKLFFLSIDNIFTFLTTIFFLFSFSLSLIFIFKKYVRKNY